MSRIAGHLPFTFVIKPDSGSSCIAESLISTDFHTAPDAFVELAKRRGGDDNITLVLLYVAETTPPS